MSRQDASPGARQFDGETIAHLVVRWICSGSGNEMPARVLLRGATVVRSTLAVAELAAAPG